MSTIDDLAAALNNHQVTDEDGQVRSEPAAEQVDSLESESVPTEEVQEEPKLQEQEPEEAEDDSGRKYVPLKRFNKIYGEREELKRELAALRQQAPVKEPQPVSVPSLDRTQALEMELLFDKYPEFNPNDDKYSPELDALAGKFVQANPSLSALQAAREAKEFAKRIGSKQAGIQQESVMVKRAVSDNGIAGRPQKVSTQPEIDIATASADDLERYLKQTGNW